MGCPVSRVTSGKNGLSIFSFKKYNQIMNQDDEYHEWQRKYIQRMFLDFLRDCREENLLTGNPTLQEAVDFIRKWTDDHFSDTEPENKNIS